MNYDKNEQMLLLGDGRSAIFIIFGHSIWKLNTCHAFDPYARNPAILDAYFIADRI